ncbi:MAG TPA: hypothetical protein VKA46_32705 [Gemmataceae bacterium]|nr:hypothetical protein [Gemmataceae bacterium]
MPADVERLLVLVTSHCELVIRAGVRREVLAALELGVGFARDGAELGQVGEGDLCRLAVEKDVVAAADQRHIGQGPAK